MTKNRIERDIQTRDNQTRDACLRPEPDFGNSDLFEIPPGVHRDGYKYHWARHNIRGTTENRIEKLLSKGWELVDASRSTSKYLDPISDNPLSDKFIYKNGYLLMERHIQFCQAEDNFIHNETIERTKATNAYINDEGHFYNSSSKRF